MPLDMRKIDGRRDAGALVKLAGVTPEVRVVDEPPQIAFEMARIDGIKAHQSGKQPPIGLGEALAAEISAPRELVFEPVEDLEQRMHGFFVSVLRRRKTGPVTPLLTVV